MHKNNNSPLRGKFEAVLSDRYILSSEVGKGVCDRSGEDKFGHKKAVQGSYYTAFKTSIKVRYSGEIIGVSSS